MLILLLSAPKVSIIRPYDTNSIQSIRRESEKTLGFSISFPNEKGNDCVPFLQRSSHFSVVAKRMFQNCGEKKSMYKGVGGVMT